VSNRIAIASAIAILPIALSAMLPSMCIAASPEFSGTWSIDLRSEESRDRGEECGLAGFVLHQSGNEIRGKHYNSAVGCGRVNEESTVRGIVDGDSAVLVVESGRNGAVVMGTARLDAGHLVWHLVDYVSQGNPQGDDLILGDGVLSRDGEG
jgi:hypothetical protein